MNCPNCGVPGAPDAIDCLGCGVVFAKWKPRVEAVEMPPSPVVVVGGSGALAAWAAPAALAIGLFLLREKVRSVFFIFNGIDLFIHEAGHPILGLFGWHWLMVAGGTLFQLGFPVAFAVHFYREDQPRSGDFCVGWLGQNFLHVGRYAADARAQELPLVGGGQHDWTYLLDCWGLLTHDIGVGMAFDFLGCALIAWACASIYRRTRAQKTASVP